MPFQMLTTSISPFTIEIERTKTKRLKQTSTKLAIIEALSALEYVMTEGLPSMGAEQINLIKSFEFLGESRQQKIIVKGYQDLGLPEKSVVIYYGPYYESNSFGELGQHICPNKRESPQPYLRDAVWEEKEVKIIIETTLDPNADERDIHRKVIVPHIILTSAIATIEYAQRENEPWDNDADEILIENDRLFHTTISRNETEIYRGTPLKSMFYDGTYPICRLHSCDNLA